MLSKLFLFASTVRAEMCRSYNKDDGHNYLKPDEPDFERIEDFHKTEIPVHQFHLHTPNFLVKLFVSQFRSKKNIGSWMKSECSF